MNTFNKLTIIIGVIAAFFISASASGFAMGWEFCATGDITSKTVMNAMKNHNCQVDVLLGDYYGKESTFVGGFKESGVPLLAACGNHDTCGTVIKYDNIKTGDKTYYGFRWNDVGFLILNTQKSISSQKSDSEKVLNTWQNDPAINHIVIALHKCVICNQSAHHKESELKDYRSQITTWEQTFPKINTLLQGHNHGFQQCEPDNPKIHVTTEGTGGRTPYPWGSATDDNCHNYLSGTKYNGFSVANVTPQDIEVHHINAVP